VFEFRYSFPRQLTGREDQTTPSETLNRRVVEVVQEVIYLTLVNGMGCQSQHDILSRIRRSGILTLAITYEVLPDVVERLRVAEG